MAPTSLCAAIQATDETTNPDSFVKGAFLLTNGLTNYESSAKPEVVSAARTMLETGVNGNARAYAEARQKAMVAC